MVLSGRDCRYMEPIFSTSRARNECLELPFAEDAEASRSKRFSQADWLSNS
jgi:hypothetical protein